MTEKGLKQKICASHPWSSLLCKKKMGGAEGARACNFAHARKRAGPENNQLRERVGASDGHGIQGNGKEAVWRWRGRGTGRKFGLKGACARVCFIGLTNVYGSTLL